MDYKKVALIPLLYNEYNYGGVLQFYALQKALINQGFEVNILKVDNEKRIMPHISRQGFVQRMVRNIYRIKNEIQLHSVLRERFANIDKFKKRYYANIVNLNKIDIRSYDAIVCGSDQIWNPGFARERTFLTFAPDDSNTIIYAASLGVENLTEEQTKRFKPLIERIKHVSVRELSAKRILDEFVNRDDIIVVLDPTLLLTPQEWDEIADVADSITDSKYVLTYLLGDYSNIKEHIKQFARGKGLSIVNIPYASGERIDTENFGDVKILNADPGTFINLIKGATFVFTDSFHGCVFSVLYKKEFYVIERDGKSPMVGRILTLFENFSIPDRFISMKTAINDLQTIDYSENDYYQKLLRKDSLGYLTESIENERA